LIAAELDARKPAGDKFLSEGRMHEARKEWDAALESYTRALEEDPSELVYMMAAAKARFQAGQAHLVAGRDLRAQGRFEEALAEFDKAHNADPAAPAIEQEIRITSTMMARPQAEGKPLPPAHEFRNPRT